MIRLTGTHRAQLLANSCKPDVDHIPVVKFSNPLGEGIWLATELNTDGDTMFGLADTRVYRLQSDAGERIIGRKVSPAWAANATTSGVASVTPDETFAALMEGRTILELSEGLQLRRVRVMGVNRIELSGFTDAMRERVRAYGLFHEIISWKLHMFVPVDKALGPEVIGRIFARWPVERIGEREAA